IVAAPLSFHPKRARLPNNPRAPEIPFLHRVLLPEEQMHAHILWWGLPRRKSQMVTQRWPPTGRSCREGPLRKGSPEISESFLMRRSLQVGQSAGDALTPLFAHPSVSPTDFV